jgi:hypothetical protein
MSEWREAGASEGCWRESEEHERFPPCRCAQVLPRVGPRRLDVDSRYIGVDETEGRFADGDARFAR